MPFRASPFRAPSFGEEIDPPVRSQDMEQHILIVEDEVLIGLSIAAALRDAGLASLHCAGGRAALVAAAQSSFAAAIVDVGLPDIDGIDVVRQLRLLSASLPIVVSTGSDVRSH